MLGKIADLECDQRGKGHRHASNEWKILVKETKEDERNPSQFTHRSLFISQSVDTCISNGNKWSNETPSHTTYTQITPMLMSIAQVDCYIFGCWAVVRLTVILNSER